MSDVGDIGVFCLIGVAISFKASGLIVGGVKVFATETAADIAAF